MSFTTNPALVPDRDRLPLKKRDQRPSPPPQQQQCDAATFKAPYPYKGHRDFKTRHTGPFQPVPRRVPALYQPWTHPHPPTRSKPHNLSAFRDHHSLAEWRDVNPLHPGLAFPPHFQHHLSGTPALHLGHPPPPPRFSPASLSNEGFQRVCGGYGWEQLTTLRDKGLTAERHSNGRSKGPYVRRKDRRVELFPRGEKATLEDRTHQHDVSHKLSKAVKHPFSGQSFVRVSPDNSNYISMKEEQSRSTSLPSSKQASPNHFPWLLPHFVAGSLIELRDGRLRRVEHLQTEDFLLGALACPDLRLSSCTVQSISPSAASSSSISISRLLILLHDQQSQELVDVYVEYPFFVRGRGWSSCNPLRTARLCGLHCRQLSVGDICLALTPISTPQPPPSSDTLEPKTSPRKSEGGCESLKASPQGLGLAEGPKKKGETVRRRHCSAPELRGPGTNCMK
ncbi:ataxin-1-like isoform X1 [Pseudochaenichthys georgianus]|uniref:ataxin-1-like isoform X1 n=1 Tax=Pseudochaenichthys georgianus TaxID=52239 RepID=UPI00146B74B7|nr:ataxin-1-like isoform X1 [Pseudochaenichthys georgianus]XP_033939525.1 ataxin-1-like isoform X1 [Pseudochaenichthys georgianus]